MIAYNLMYRSNEHIDMLLHYAAENKTLRGTLVKKGEDFFVKHLQAEIFIPVSISSWETDLELTYNNNIDQTVRFTLNKAKNFKTLKAYLADRKFCSRYINLLHIKAEGNPIPAVIVRKNDHCVFARILGGAMAVVALVPKDINEEQRNHFFRFNKGDRVMVKLKNIANRKSITVSIEDEILLKINLHPVETLNS